MSDLKISSDTARYCYLDIDIDNGRQKLATTAAFVHATDTRYGFSSKDLRELGGSEVNRLDELMATDHEWQSRRVGNDQQGVLVKRPPRYGSRIVVELDWATAPMACENFATLCHHGSSNNNKPAPIGTCGKPLSYRNTTVHRVVPGFIMQAGDFVMGNGSGGESIYGGKKFKDERAGLLKKHSRRGQLGMGNSGKNSNSSQWYITFAAAPQCDGKHILFGRVVSGWDVIAAIEKCGQANGSSEEPAVSIIVTDCGVWKPWTMPGDGYWFDKPDPERYSGISPVFCVRPRVAVVVPNQSVFEKFQAALSSLCAVVQIMVNGDGEEAIADAATKVTGLLADCAVGVIIVAPACKAIMDVIQPPDDSLQCDKVIMKAKPVDAATVLESHSWLADRSGWYIWH